MKPADALAAAAAIPAIVVLVGGLGSLMAVHRVLEAALDRVLR